LGEILKNKWKYKLMHGKCKINVDRQLISEEGMLLWLMKVDLKAEIESEIMLAQEQELQAMHYVCNKTLNTVTDSTYRLCHQFDKTIDHIIPECPIFPKEQYIKIHDRLRVQLHFSICKEFSIKFATKCLYEHVPKSVETSQCGKVDRNVKKIEFLW
jgi:hypothetical protein